MNIVLNIKRKFKPTLRNQVEFISAHFSDIDSLFESEADILEADIQISYMKPGKLYFLKYIKDGIEIYVYYSDMLKNYIITSRKPTHILKQGSFEDFNLLFISKMDDD